MDRKVLFAINTMGRGGAEVALLALLGRPELTGDRLNLRVMLGQGELLDRLPENVHLLNTDYSDADVLSRSGKRTLYRRTAELVLRRGALIRCLPYMVRNGLAMVKNHRVLPEKLLWRAVAQAAPPDGPYDLAVAYIEGAATYYVSRSVQARRKVAFVHIDYQKAGYTRRLDGGCYRAFDAIFCVSEEVRGAFLSVYPEYAHKTSVFPNIIDRPRIRALSEQGEGFTDGFTGVRLMMVGRLEPVKAIELSVEAMALLKQRRLPVRWYVFGEGSERAALEKQIAALGLQEDFLLPGVTDNPYPYFRQADIYVHCSRYEGRSIAIQEAQTLGRPMVVSDCSGNRLQVTDGVDGLLVELTPQAIADAVERLIRDEDLRKALGRNAAAKQFPSENVEKLFA